MSTAVAAVERLTALPARRPRFLAEGDGDGGLALAFPLALAEGTKGSHDRTLTLTLASTLLASPRTASGAVATSVAG
jgi:hypothetical protein